MGQSHTTFKIHLLPPYQDSEHRKPIRLLEYLFKVKLRLFDAVY